MVENVGAPCRIRTCGLLVRSCSRRRRSGHHQLLLSAICPGKRAGQPFSECDHFPVFRTGGGHKIGHTTVAAAAPTSMKCLVRRMRENEFPLRLTNRPVLPKAGQTRPVETPLTLPGRLIARARTDRASTAGSGGSRWSDPIDAVDGGNAGVVEAGEHLRLPLEPGEPSRVRREGVGEDFQRDITAELRISRPIDFSDS